MTLPANEFLSESSSTLDDIGDTVVYNAGFSFQISGPTSVHNHISVNPTSAYPRSVSAVLKRRIDGFLQRSDRVYDRFNSAQSRLGEGCLLGGQPSNCPARSVVPKIQKHHPSECILANNSDDGFSTNNESGCFPEKNNVRSATGGGKFFSNGDDKTGNGFMIKCLPMGKAELTKTKEIECKLSEDCDTKLHKKYPAPKPPTVTVSLSLHSTVSTNSVAGIDMDPERKSVSRLSKSPSIKKYPAPLPPSGNVVTVCSTGHVRSTATNAVSTLTKRDSPKTVQARAGSPVVGKPVFLPVKVNKQEANTKPVSQNEADSNVSKYNAEDTSIILEATPLTIKKGEKTTNAIVNGGLPPTDGKAKFSSKKKDSGESKKVRKISNKRDNIIDESDSRRRSMSSESEDRTSRASSVSSNTSKSSESSKFGSRKINKLSNLTNKFEPQTNGTKNREVRNKPLRLPISKISDLTSKFQGDNICSSVRKFSLKKSNENLNATTTSLDATDYPISKVKDNVVGINVKKIEPVVSSAKKNDVRNICSEEHNNKTDSVEKMVVTDKTDSSISNYIKPEVEDNLSNQIGRDKLKAELEGTTTVINNKNIGENITKSLDGIKDVNEKKAKAVCEKLVSSTPIPENLIPNRNPAQVKSINDSIVNVCHDLIQLKECNNKPDDVINLLNKQNYSTLSKSKCSSEIEKSSDEVEVPNCVVKPEEKQISKQINDVADTSNGVCDNYDKVNLICERIIVHSVQCNGGASTENNSGNNLVRSEISSSTKTLLAPVILASPPSVRKYAIRESKSLDESPTKCLKSSDSCINEDGNTSDENNKIAKNNVQPTPIIVIADVLPTLSVCSNGFKSSNNDLISVPENNTSQTTGSNETNNKYLDRSISEIGRNSIQINCNKASLLSNTIQTASSVVDNAIVKDASNLESVDATSVRNIIDILNNQKDFRLPSHLRESAELIVAQVQRRTRCKSLPRSTLSLPTPTTRSKYIPRTRPARKSDPSMAISIPSLTEFLDQAEQRLARAIRSPLPVERTESCDTDDDVFLDTLDHLDTLPEDENIPVHCTRSNCSTPHNIGGVSPTPKKIVEETSLLLSETDILLRKSRSQHSLRRSFSRSMSFANMNKLAEVTADLQEQHSTSHLASERMEAEQSERMRLEKEVSRLQEDVDLMTNANDKLEMERLTLRSEMIHQQELNGDSEENDSTIYKRKYEWGVRELELLKKQTKQQEQDAFDQLVVLKKQLEKKAQDSHEEAEEQRQVVGQLKKKSQRLQAEMNDLKMLLEEQNSRNNLLEKKQRKFDQEMNILQDELKKEKLSKDKLQREKDQTLAEKYSLEQEFSTMKLEGTLKSEKITALKSELDDIQYSDKGEEETTMLKKVKHDLDKKVKDQEEELDDLAGQVQMLESAKIRLEMSIEQTRKENRMESQQREEEVEDVRMSMNKKIKGLENQMESDYEERTQLLREKHDLERRLADATDRTISNVDEEYIHKLKKELKKTKALLKDTQTMLDKTQSESSNKLIVRQLKTQLEDAEFAKTAALKARQCAESDCSEMQIQLDEAYRSKKDTEDRCLRITKEKSDIHMQLEENEEEVSELMKKYKAAVSQLSVDQITMADQTQQMAELEHQKQILQEKLLELSSKVEVLEGETANIHTQRRLQMKIKELESKLELEQTTKNRLDGQIVRLKDHQERLNSELDAIRQKEMKSSDETKKFSRLLRESKEDLHSVQQKNTDVVNRKFEIEKQLELSESEVATLKSDLKLAFKRIEDLQQALQGDISDTDSDLIDSGSDSESSLSSYLTASMRCQRTSSNSTLRTPPSEMLAESKDDVPRSGSGRSMSAISEDLEESNYKHFDRSHESFA